MERRLTSEQIDRLLKEIVTEEFVINALKEFNLYPEFQQTYEVEISKVEPLKWAESQYELSLNNGISNFSFNHKSSEKIKLEKINVEIGNYNYAA
nr:hypothetical protein [uncultured Granulicatella sp.]